MRIAHQVESGAFNERCQWSTGQHADGTVCTDVAAIVISADEFQKCSGTPAGYMKKEDCHGSEWTVVVGI